MNRNSLKTSIQVQNEIDDWFVIFRKRPLKEIMFCIERVCWSTKRKMKCPCDGKTDTNDTNCSLRCPLVHKYQPKWNNNAKLPNCETTPQIETGSIRYKRCALGSVSFSCKFETFVGNRNINARFRILNFRIIQCDMAWANNLISKLQILKCDVIDHGLEKQCVRWFSYIDNQHMMILISGVMTNMT